LTVAWLLLLTRPSTESRIRLGMTRADVEAVVKPGCHLGEVPVENASGYAVGYDCPDGRLQLWYRRAGTRPKGMQWGQGSDVVIHVLMDREPTVLERLRAWLGW